MDTVNLIYYSPTGTTRQVVKETGQKLGLKLTSQYNITKLQTEFRPEISDNSVSIIGVPVYGGRLPTPAVERMHTFHSNHSPAVIIAVYGNRAYDDSLLELKDIVHNCGFRIIAGAAFIGEHSFSSKDKPIARGRPDEQDLIKCVDFGRMIKDKLVKTEDMNTISEPRIPGKHPYKERKQLPVTVFPETDNDTCNRCGKCIATCPSNAITINHSITTNGNLCTWCCACVRNCPNGARTFNNPTINTIQEKLFANCTIRKEPEFFL